MPKERLEPEQQRSFLRLVYLRTQNVRNLSKVLLNTKSSVADEAVKNETCKRLYHASHCLVLVCQNFAAKHPGTATDRFRSKARNVRMVVKQLIHHSLQPEDSQRDQTDILMQINVSLATGIIAIIQTFISEQTKLADNVPLPEPEPPKDSTEGESPTTSLKEPPPRTIEELAQKFLQKIRIFMTSLQDTSQSIQSCLERKAQFNGLLSTHFLCLGQMDDFQTHLACLSEVERILKQCDLLSLQIADFTADIRVFVDACLDEEKQNILALVVSIRSTASQVVCCLRSTLLAENERDLPVAQKTTRNVQELSHVPESLKQDPLFHGGDDQVRREMIQSREEELQAQIQMLEDQVVVVHSRMSVKRTWLQHLKVKQETVLDKEILRHQWQEQWIERELQYLEHQEGNINSFCKFLDTEKRRLQNTGLSALSPQAAELPDPLERANSQQRISLRNFTRSSTYFSKKKDRSSRKARPDAPIDRRASVTEPPKELFAAILDNADHVTPETISTALKNKILAQEIERALVTDKIKVARARIQKLHEQVVSRKKYHILEMEKAVQTASKDASALVESFTQQHQSTLEELRDLHKTESMLLLQIEKLNERLVDYQASKQSFLASASSSTTQNVQMRGDAAIELVSDSFCSQFSALAVSLAQLQPQQEVTQNDQNDANIWKESLVTSGNRRTAIFSSDTEGGNRMRAGTLNQLIMRLTDEKRHDLNFLKTFIFTFESFTTTDRFFQKLEERYDVPRDQQSDISDTEWKRTIVLPIQGRVYNVIRLWLDMRFTSLDYRLMKRVNSFIDTRLRRDGHSLYADALSEMIKRKISQQRKKSSPRRKTVPDIFPTHMISDFFAETDAQCLAQHITYVDANLYAAIQPVELIDHLKSSMRSPNLTKMIERFNLVSGWVAERIIHNETLVERQAAMIKFIDVAEALHKMNNFSGLLAVIGGLTTSAVHRMRQTREGIPQGHTDKLHQLKTLMNSENSYKSYREALHSVSPPLVPYLGVYLTDLTFINDGNSNNVEGLINFRKRELIYRVIEEFQQYQQVSYDFQIEKEILAFVSVPPAMNEEQLFGLSRQLEP